VYQILWVRIVAIRILVLSLSWTGLTGSRGSGYPTSGSDHPELRRDKKYCWAGSSDLWADHPTFYEFQWVAVSDQSDRSGVPV